MSTAVGPGRTWKPSLEAGPSLADLYCIWGWQNQSKFRESGAVRPSHCESSTALTMKVPGPTGPRLPPDAYTPKWFAVGPGEMPLDGSDSGAETTYELSRAVARSIAPAAVTRSITKIVELRVHSYPNGEFSDDSLPCRWLRIVERSP